MRKIVLIHAPAWCRPCREMERTYALAERDTGMTMEVHDVDTPEGSTAAAKYGVRAVPTLVALEDDRPVNTLSGLRSLGEVTAFFQGVPYNR